MNQRRKQNLNLGFVSLFNDFSSEVVTRVLPFYLLTIVQTSFVGLGLVEAIGEATATLGKLFAGFYSDKVGKRKPIIFAGYGLSVLSRFLLIPSASLIPIVGARFLEKVGKSVRTPARDALISDLSDASDRGRNFGINRGLDSIGAVLGLLAVYVFLVSKPMEDQVALKTILLWACVAGVLALLVLGVFVKEPSKEKEYEAKKIKLTWDGLDGVFKKYLVVAVFFSLASSSDAFIIVRMKDLGLKMADIFLALVFFNIVSAVTAFFGPSHSDRVGRKVMLLCGWGIYATTYLLLGLDVSSSAIWFILIFYGLFYGFTDGVEKAFVSDFERIERRGQAYGWLGLVQGLGVIPANLLFGYLYKGYGARWAFTSSCGFAILGFILLLLLKTKKESFKHG